MDDVQEDTADMEIESTPMAMRRRPYRRSDVVVQPTTPSLAEDRTRRVKRRSKRERLSSARMTVRMTRLQMHHLRRIEGTPAAMRTEAERDFLRLFTP